MTPRRTTTLALLLLAPGCDELKEFLDTGGYGDPPIVCEPGTTWDGQECVDDGDTAQSEDECAVDNGGCGDPAYVTCVDQEDSAPSCEDIDECATDNGGCGDVEVYTCVNEYAAPPSCTYDEAADFAALTDGVQVLEYGGSLPSALVVHGLEAFPVAVDSSHRSSVAAGRAGAGRVLHYGHETHIGGALNGEGDSDQLLLNALSWMGGDAPVVGLVGNLSTLGDFLDAQGVTRQAVSDVTQLDGVQVLAMSSSTELSAAQIDAVQTFVVGGGGLITGGHAWYWGYSNENAALNHPANKLLNDLGLTVTTSTAASGAWPVPSAPHGPLLHSSYALDQLLAHVDGALTLSLSDQLVGVASAGVAITHLPIDFDYFDRARAFRDSQAPVVPSASAPLVRAEQPISELVVRVDEKFAMELPSDQVVAHPAADDFPGAVPTEAERVNEDVSLVSNFEGQDSRWSYSGAGSDLWLSTGLYAPPGELIDVDIGNNVVDRGLQVSIGAHSDSLWGKESWQRFPRVVRTWSLEAPTTQVASAFGGPIYVRVPAGSAHGVVVYTIKGAVQAPLFVKDETITQEWIDEVRQRPGPWAELVGEHFALTVPSDAIRDLDDPQALMEFWDSVLVADAELSAIPIDRPRGERFVVDRQISAGWMHSGYPLMAHLESTTELTDLDSLLTNGAWGPFHELGHNHQWRDWLLPGTTETTCNLFSVYVSEQLLGIDRSVAHSALSASNRSTRTSDHIAAGANFDDWSVWVALESYLQLQEAFGWSAYQGVFAEYQGLAEADRPTDDQERIDQWVLRFSTQVNRDLGPFFVAWGLPVSQSVLTTASALPPWTEDPMNP